jgi:hypothetical protein
MRMQHQLTPLREPDDCLDGSAAGNHINICNREMK